MNNILIIDDTRIILSIAKKIIEDKLDDIIVTTEVNPLHGKKLMLENEYQLIILDIIMPNITGIDLLKWIKEQEHLKGTKVIMFTSLNDSSALVESFQLGAYDFISKPLEENEFISRINHAIVEYNQEALIHKGFQQISKKNAELEELNKKLRTTQAELIQSERLASVGYLAAGMAHEINNPLGFVKSNFLTMKDNVNALLGLYTESKLYSQRIGEKKEVDEKFEQLEQKYDYNFIFEDVNEIFLDIEHGTKRIETIISALRNFSEVDSQGKKELVLIADIFRNIEGITKMKFESNIHLTTKDDTTDMIYCNKAEFNLSILSLIDNAYEAIEKKGELFKGEIKVTASQYKKEISIQIEDNGVGMKDEVRRFALNPFYTTKDVGSGSGLGLTTAYNFFVNELKARMDIDSEEEVGTRILILISVED